MANLEEMTRSVREEGYSEVNAEARVCQDIVLKAIAQSKFSRNITIKGGVVMRGITGDARRATQDMDFDFIRYSLSEDSIREFIKQLNCLDGIEISIPEDTEIEELSQQEYNGKRVYVVIKDDTGHSFMSKIDLGVHKNLQIEQDEYCFDVCMDDVGASLLINSKEQIFAEKLRSLLRFGPLSTRYKDIFDLSYLSGHTEKERLIRCLNTYIFDDPGIRENQMQDIIRRVNATFNNRLYRRNISRARRVNWLDISYEEAFSTIVDYLRKL